MPGSMRRILSTAALTLSVIASLAAYGSSPQNAPAPQPIVAADGTMSTGAQNALVQQYCAVCHNDAQNKGGLSLEHFDAAKPDPNVVGLMVDMLKGGDMPPKGRPRPDAATLQAFATSLTSHVGAAPNANASAEPIAMVPAHPVIVSFPHDGDRMASAAQTSVLQTICIQCHTDKRKPGGVSFEHLTADDIARDPELAERMVAKLRAGMMPPPEATKRPDDAAVQAFVVSLERRIDQAAAQRPHPGSRMSQRLNRVEYARTIRAMLGLDVDVSRWLPPDTISHNFDNIAAVQDFSPTLVQSYLDAASDISRLAIGDPEATPTSASYDISQFASQVNHVADAPFGTRGGLSVVHVFPADGRYRFKLTLFGTLGGRLFGLTTIGEQVQISIDDTQVALLDVDNRMSEISPQGLTMTSEPIAVKAGPRHVSAAFVQRAEGPVDDLIAPQTYTLADLDIGDAKGLTLVPHLRTLRIDGPFDVTGVSDNATRDKIFICRPEAPADELPCAKKIIANLAETAYRGRVSPSDMQDLMNFYAQGRSEGSFDTGIRMALQAMLVSPHFLFRIEPQPVDARAGQDYRVGDRALASRLSYFLWGEPPDATLMKAAEQGRLHDVADLDAQVMRMLKDSRSFALSTRFASQWLRLQDVSKVRPDAVRYPMYDARIERALVRETELFFDSIVKGDHDVLDLLTADYTYLNEDLAAFYGIPGISGTAFRKVPLDGTHRRGLLGQASILVETSVATRSDPVLRGKWVLEVLLGQPPPPPPPNVPALESTGAVSANGQPLTIRQRMEEHRKSPFCASCHRVIDPIGLALENFEPTGQFRVTDNDAPVDASTVLYDGTPMNGLNGLVDALLKRRETILRVFAANLMAYALGRDVQSFDMPTVRAIVQKAGASGNRFSSYVLGIVNSDAFRMSRASEPYVTTTDRADRAPAKRF